MRSRSCFRSGLGLAALLAVATGRGDTFINDCDPSCDEGTFHKYTGKLRVHKVKVCPQDGLRHYTKAKFTFTGDRPTGYPKRFRQPFPCSMIDN